MVDNPDNPGALSRMAAFNANALMSTNPWSSRLSIFVI
jgi:hypothetical protein